MAHTPRETISIGWCDSGTVHGRFTDGIVDTIIQSRDFGIDFSSKLRVTGNQIGRQRQVLFDAWADEIKTDWLLWVDSDIVLTTTTFKMLWDAADPVSMPIITGTYFISDEVEGSLMQPFPAIFNEGKSINELTVVHPLPENEVIKVDIAGFGLTLMHKSIIEPIRAIDPEYSLFGEKMENGDKFVSEDVAFFRKLKEAKIQLHAHTGATVKHLKTFSFDKDYYNLYWTGLEKQIFTKG